MSGRRASGRVVGAGVLALQRRVAAIAGMVAAAIVRRIAARSGRGRR